MEELQLKNETDCTVIICVNQREYILEFLPNFRKSGCGHFNVKKYTMKYLREKNFTYTIENHCLFVNIDVQLPQKSIIHLQYRCEELASIGDTVIKLLMDKIQFLENRIKQLESNTGYWSDHSA